MSSRATISFSSTWITCASGAAGTGCPALGAASARAPASATARLKAAERWIDFPRCDLPGRAVVDTYLLVQLYDVTAREMTSYGLKAAAVYFGVTPEDGAGRTYLEGSRIAETFRDRPGAFLRLPGG